MDALPILLEIFAENISGINSLRIKISFTERYFMERPMNMWLLYLPVCGLYAVGKTENMAVLEVV